MKSTLILAAALAVGVAGVAFAANEGDAKPVPAETAATAKAWKNDPDRLVCTLERDTGSNRPHRTCMTAAQRKQMAEATQQRLTSQQANNGIKGPGDNVSSVPDN